MPTGRLWLNDVAHCLLLRRALPPQPNGFEVRSQRVAAGSYRVPSALLPVLCTLRRHDQREQNLPKVALGHRGEGLDHSSWSVLAHLLAESGEGAKRLLQGCRGLLAFISHRMAALLGPAAARAHRASDCERPNRYLRRRRPRIDPLAWGRFRVLPAPALKRLGVPPALPRMRLFASLIRSRNLSAAVLLRPLAIFDSFRCDGSWGDSIVTCIPNAGDLDRFCDFRALPDRRAGASPLIEPWQRQILG